MPGFESQVIPEHVPAELVFDFDYYENPDFHLDPYGKLMSLLNEMPPIFYTTSSGGHWIVADNNAVSKAARATEIFSSAPPAVNGVTPAAMVPVMIDPPAHGLYRAPLNVAFSPKRMAQLDAPIRELTRRQIAEVKDQGRCEFVRAIAEPTPVLTFLKLMGLPAERKDEFRDLIRQMQSGGPTGGMMAIAKIDEIMTSYIEQRRERPEDDLISTLWQLKIEDRPITIEEMRNYSILLFIAGLDTVINTVSFAMRHLALDGELQNRLRENPSLIRGAVEETLRYYSIVLPQRVVAHDATFEGVQFRKGERVILLLAAANLDGDAFSDPLTFDVERPTRAHIGFNTGPHRCAGAHLARIELNILFEEWLSAIPSFRLDPHAPPKLRAGALWGCDELNLVW